MPRSVSAGCRSETLNDKTIINRPAGNAARRHTRETLPVIMKPTLELPKTIRPLRLDEIPKNSSAKERIELRETARIVEGYKILPKDNNQEHSELPFNFFAEINIDNSRLWDLIIALSEELPEESALIFNHADSEPNYGKYLDKKYVLEFLSHYKKEVTGDTFIDIGLIFHTESELIEIFIPESKYIKFWGVNQKSFLKIMEFFNLQEVTEIEFVDEYPKVREALSLFDNNITESEKLIKILKKEFL